MISLHRYVLVIQFRRDGCMNALPINMCALAVFGGKGA